MEAVLGELGLQGHDPVLLAVDGHHKPVTRAIHLAADLRKDVNLKDRTLTLILIRYQTYHFLLNCTYV